MSKTRPYVVYGRAEPTLWKDRSRSKKPGYQVLATSDNLDPLLLERLTSVTVLDSSETHRLWFTDDDEDLPLWSFCEIGNGDFALGRTIFAKNNDYLDKAGRIVTISHTIVITNEELMKLKGSPFPIIHSNAGIFIEGVDDLVDLVGNGIERPAINFDSLDLASNTVPIEQFDGLCGFDSDSIDRLIKDNSYYKCPIVVRGSYRETMSFVEMLFLIAKPAVRLHLNFSMLCRGEQHASTRIQVGRKHPEKIYVSIESKSVVFPPKPMTLATILSKYLKNPLSTESKVDQKNTGPVAGWEARLKNDPKFAILVAGLLILFPGYFLWNAYRGRETAAQTMHEKSLPAAMQHQEQFKDEVQEEIKLDFTSVDASVFRFGTTEQSLALMAQYDVSKGMFIPVSPVDLKSFEISKFVTIGNLIGILYPEDLKQIKLEKDVKKKRERIKNLIQTKGWEFRKMNLDGDSQSHCLMDADAIVPRSVADDFIEKFQAYNDLRFSYHLPNSDEGNRLLFQSEIQWDRDTTFITPDNEHLDKNSNKRIDMSALKLFRLVRKPVFDRNEYGSTRD
jgi:hypothetical protein